MRQLTGDILLPVNAPSRTAAFVLIEVRDVSVADAPSVVVAQHRLLASELQPGGHIPFGLQVPEVAPGRSLALRVHISLEGIRQPQPGDLLSTSRYELPATGPLRSLSVGVEVI